MSKKRWNVLLTRFRTLSLAILTLTLLLTIQPHAAPDPPPGEGSADPEAGVPGAVELRPGAPSYCDYGKPWRMKRYHASDALEVTFAVAADPQFLALYDDGTGWKPESKLLRQQKVAVQIKLAGEASDPDFTGVVVVGDLTQTKGCRELLAFRQIYEYGYSDSADVGYAGEACLFDENLYAWRSQVRYPMFPVWGNHDDPTQGSDDDPKVLNYIAQLIHNSAALYETPIEGQQKGIQADKWYDGQGDYTDKGFYAWEWGNFHFIALGLWAFADNGDDVCDDCYDEGKVGWLKDHLAAIGTEKAIVIFQHYGFDICTGKETGCSFEEKYKDDPRWWTWGNAKLLLNVLCNRDSWEEPCGTPERPKYNVVGIFTGHKHGSGHCHICPEKDDGNFMGWDNTKRCKYTTYEPGECDAYFDNFIVNDAGQDSHAGYTTVRLNAWPKSVRPDDPNASTMGVQHHVVYNFDYDWDNWDPFYNCKYDNKTTYSHHGSEYYRYTLATEFLTFRQGEPNGGRNENCGELLHSGRLNDQPCADKRQVACTIGDSWYVTQGEYTWDEADTACEKGGGDFGMPQTVEDQAWLMQAVLDGGYDSVWVNYTDQDAEGHWTIALWDSGQPDGGTRENCAIFGEGGGLADTPCADQRKAACFDSWAKTWHLTPGEMVWGDARQACYDISPSYKLGMPQSMGQQGELQRVLKSSSSKHSVWVNYTDQDKEGTWTSADYPHTLWGSGQPDGGYTENCAIFNRDGRLGDTPCADQRRAACYDSQTKKWQLTPMSSGEIVWDDAWQACHDLDPAYRFGMPQSDEQHAVLLQAYLDSGWSHDIWVNYTDQSEEWNWWTAASYLQTLWDPGQPDGGTRENCAIFGKGGGLADTPCTDQRRVACYDSQNKKWQLTSASSGETVWDDAWQACHDLGDTYEFAAPQSGTQQLALLKALGDWKHSIWVNYTDQAEEGTWLISCDPTVELQSFWLPVVTKD